MGQLKATQIVNNSLTGASFIRDFRLYDETELCVKGDIRIWQDNHWLCIKDLPQAYHENDLTHSPDLETDYWRKLVSYNYERYEFESFTVYAPGLDTGTLNIALQISAARMLNNFTSYNNFLFDFEDENNNIIMGKQFTDETSFIDFINNNFSGPTIVRVYALIDKSKKNIHTMRTKNVAYGTIKGRDNNGRGNYYKSRVANNTSWSEIDNFSNDILERITGVTPTDTTSSKNAIWFQRDEKMYKLYTNNSKQTITFKGGLDTNRKKFNPYTNAFLSLNPTDEFTIIPGSNAFYGVNPTNGSWIYISNQKLANNNSYLSFYSLVKVYGLRDKYKNIAVMVKPVGIDEIRFNYFEDDISNYIFYVGTYGFDDKLKIYKMNSGSDYSVVPDKNSNSSIVINRSLLVNHQVGAGLNGMNIKKLVFFYGDNTGKISEFSSSIKYSYRNNGATFIPLLDRRGKY